jgi:hypothetical protein
MNTQKRTLGKTHITRSQPWGLHPRNGHRLLCSDGVIRAAELAETADTWFSVPASVRVNGRRVSGYMTVAAKDGMETETTLATYVFRHHDRHADKLPAWPTTPPYGLNIEHPINAILAKAHA